MAVTTISIQRSKELRGWRYDIAVADERFLVRVYDELPKRAIVVEPTTARQSAVAVQLIRFLLGQDHTEVQFYFGPEGLYRTVDPQTLEFI
ncbi:MAG TPA: hypothetical protein VH280_06560 [Verrucomicrobiae bacterium]|nr:hypothetical protein [Verrucomicrobiae bacterium]